MEAYQLQLNSCSGALAKFASRYEASFVCKRFVRARGSERAIWVPSADGFMRIDSSAIDKVDAEGDYMCIQSEGRRWMLHTTMADMQERLGDEDFVKIHRSTIIRCGFIERLGQEGRVWTARLADGSSERIARSQVAQVTAKLRTNSSTSAPSWSKRDQLGDPAAIIQRKNDASTAVK